uniref:(California timema) hypothetical protein n=1 Tax=Timema californicum TaxID=61474 RepID=A0A7R9J9J3_TIMCA|nr:unnamed protein product [Timema californicum]
MDQKGAHGVIVMGWTFIKNIIADDDEQKTLTESNLENLYGNLDEVCLFLSQLLSNPIFQSGGPGKLRWRRVVGGLKGGWRGGMRIRCIENVGKLDNACGNVEAVGQWRNLVQSRMWRQLAKGTPTDPPPPLKLSREPLGLESRDSGGRCLRGGEDRPTTPLSPLARYSGSLLKVLCYKAKDTAAVGQRCYPISFKASMQSIRALGPVEYKSKPILWDGGREGESCGVDSQPTKVSFRARENRWITKTVEKSYIWKYQFSRERVWGEKEEKVQEQLQEWSEGVKVCGSRAKGEVKLMTRMRIRPNKAVRLDGVELREVENVSYGMQNLKPKTVANLTVSMKILANIVHSGFIVEGDMVLPVEATLNLMAKFNDVLEPPNQLLANCLDIITYLWMDYRDEMFFKLDMIKFLPHVNSLNINPISCINGKFDCGGSLGPMVVLQEFSSAEYPLLKSFLQFVQVLLELANALVVLSSTAEDEEIEVQISDMDYLCPLEARIMYYPNDKNHLRILHATVDYIYHTFNPNLPTLAVELMRSFAVLANALVVLSSTAEDGEIKVRNLVSKHCIWKCVQCDHEVTAHIVAAPKGVGSQIPEEERQLLD